MYHKYFKFFFFYFLSCISVNLFRRFEMHYQISRDSYLVVRNDGNKLFVTKDRAFSVSPYLPLAHLEG